MKRRWSPMSMPQSRGFLSGPHANLIHGCSDTLRRYCESLWYSGLEYIRPSDEEIFARCGILFYNRPIPTDILFTLYYQLDNLFAMSKVIHTIRSITHWLNATEIRAFEELSIYELHLQIPNFIEKLLDHLKSLKLCEQLLQHLGSIYHRILKDKPTKPFAVRAIVDYTSDKPLVNVRANQWYQVQNNMDPHVWKLCDPVQLVPSFFLEASTETGEERMLRRLQKRFDEFLVMCHSRSRRQLFSRVTKQLQKNNKYATLPAMASAEPQGRLTPLEGLYFARSPNPSKRWRSLCNPKIIGQQPSLCSCNTPEDFYCPETVRRMLTKLRQWLHDLPSPVALMNEANKSRCALPPRGSHDSDDRLCDDEIVDHLQRWWGLAYPLVPNQTQLDRIVNEACFLKNFNDILRTRIDLNIERQLNDRHSHRTPTFQSTYDHQPTHTQVLVEELLNRLSEPFYHPRSGRYSYRWVQRTLSRSNSPLPRSMNGTPLFNRSTTIRDASL